MSLASVFEIQQSILTLPTEPLHVITNVITLDKKSQFRLVAKSAFFGMSFGALVMYAVMILG
jgi:hypothetical protein